MNRYEEDECLQYLLIPLEDIDIEHLYYWNQKSSCFINAQWSVDSKSWVDNETSPGSIPLPNYFSNPTKDNRCLKEVGYFGNRQQVRVSTFLFTFNLSQPMRGLLY